MNLKRNDLEDMLTVKDIAERWNICTRSVRRMVVRGTLQPVRLSARCIRFRVSDVMNALSHLTGQNVLQATSGGLR